VQNVKQGATALRTWLSPKSRPPGSPPVELMRRPPDGPADPLYAHVPSDDRLATTEDQANVTAVEVPAVEESSQHHKDAGRERKCATEELQQVEEKQEEETMVRREQPGEDAGIDQPGQEEEGQTSPTNSGAYSEDFGDDVWRYEPPMKRSLKAHFFIHDKGARRDARAGLPPVETAVRLDVGRNRGCSGMPVCHRILALASGTLVAGLAAAAVLRVRRSQQAATDDDADSMEPSKADFRVHMERIYGSPQATFAAMDEDRDGRASFDVFADELHRFWPELNLSQARYAFAGLDCNGDRILEMSEFVDGVMIYPGFFGCTTTTTTSTTATATVTSTTTTVTSTLTATSTTVSLTSSTTTSITTTKTSTLTMTISSTTTTMTQTRTGTSTTTSTSRTVTVSTTTTTATTTTTIKAKGWWGWLDPLKNLNPFQPNGFLHPHKSAPTATDPWKTGPKETARTTTPEVGIPTTAADPEEILGSWVSDNGVGYNIRKMPMGQRLFSINVEENRKVSSLLQADGPWFVAQLAGVGFVRLRVLKRGLPDSPTLLLLSNFRNSATSEWGPDTISHKATGMSPSPAPLSPPSSPPSMTFYMYRAQDKENYEVMNNNLGNLAGVLWYLHHEVVPLCPRHHHVTRILRYKVTMKPTQEVVKAANYRPSFAPFVAMDLCRCTTPGCPAIWKRYGYAPGCQEQAPGPDYFYPLGVWYSLPGPCPSEDCWHKSQTCKAREPGGRCPVPSGTRECTWHLEDAGEIDLDELVGISNHTAFCKAGKKEFVPHLDRGLGVSFWDGYHNKTRCEERVHKVEGLFNSKFPGLPRTMPEPKCRAVPR